jgi:ABC-type nitrate/sulfonate/bicarbonate transport system permease component
MSAHSAKYICTPTTGSMRYVLPVAGLVLFLLAWVAVTKLELVNPNFLPSPKATFGALAEAFVDAPPQTLVEGTKGEWRDIQPGWDTFVHSSAIQGAGFSLKRIFLALFWACLFGIPIGIFMGAFGWFESLLQALVMPMRNAPIMAFAPLFILIYGIEEQMKISFLAFGTIVFIIPAAFDAVRNVPPLIIDKAVDMGFRPMGTLWYYVLPSALPRLWDGIRLCTGVAWTYLVAAEVMNVTTGLGAMEANAQRFQNTPRVYAAILIILILGVLSDYLFRVIKKVVPMLNQGSEA